jgi:hypothetical protein
MLHSDLYDKISIEVYKEIYAEAKDKYLETYSQSNVITGRTIKAFLLIIGLTGWAANSFWGLEKKIPVVIFLYLMLLVWAIHHTYKIIVNRKAPLQGTMPRVIYKTSEDLTNEEYDRDKVFYYQQIGRYQKKIDTLEDGNVTRGKMFNTLISISFVYFLSTVVIYLYKSSHP